MPVVDIPVGRWMSRPSLFRVNIHSWPVLSVFYVNSMLIKKMKMRMGKVHEGARNLVRAVDTQYLAREISKT